MNILIALIPALAWGINPTIVTKTGGRAIQQQVGTAFGAAIFAVVAYAIFQPVITTQVIIGSIISGAFWSLGSLMQYKAYQEMGASSAFAIGTGLNIVLSAAIGVLFFHEWSTPKILLLGISGLVLIIIGICITAFSNKSEAGANTAKGLLFVVISSIGLVAYSSVPRFFAVSGTDALLPQAVGIIVTSLLFALFERQEGSKLFEKVTWLNIVPGLVWSIANIGLLYSNKLNGIAVGFTLSQMAIAVSTLSGLFILHEYKEKSIKEKMIFAVLLMIVGAVLIGLTKA